MVWLKAPQQTYVDLIVAQAGANVVCIDTWRKFQSYELATSLYTDTLHPNGYGYDDAVLSMLGGLAVA